MLSLCVCCPCVYAVPVCMLVACLPSDAGKSTIGGQILYLANMVDERTIQKYEREAKDKNRESWYMAYIMDTNEEERAKVRGEREGEGVT